MMIDADGNGKTYVELQVAPNGNVFDTYLPSGASTRTRSIPKMKPFSWNSKMVAKVHVDGTLNKREDQDKGWTVELAIPLEDVKGMDDKSALKLPPDAGRRLAHQHVPDGRAAGQAAAGGRAGRRRWWVTSTRSTGSASWCSATRRARCRRRAPPPAAGAGEGEGGRRRGRRRSAPPATARPPPPPRSGAAHEQEEVSARDRPSPREAGRGSGAMAGGGVGIAAGRVLAARRAASRGTSTSTSARHVHGSGETVAGDGPGGRGQTPGFAPAAVAAKSYAPTRRPTAGARRRGSRCAGAARGGARGRAQAGRKPPGAGRPARLGDDRSRAARPRRRAARAGRRSISCSRTTGWSSRRLTSCSRARRCGARPSSRARARGEIAEMLRARPSRPRRHRRRPRGRHDLHRARLAGDAASRCWTGPAAAAARGPRADRGAHRQRSRAARRS